MPKTRLRLPVGRYSDLGSRVHGDAQREADQPGDDPQAQHRAAADAEDAPGDEGPHPFAPGDQSAPAPFAAAEDLVGQAGDDGDGHDQAEHHRAGDGDGDVAEELAGLVLDEDDGQEDGHRGQGAGQERPPDLRGPVQGRAHPGLPHLLVAEDVLEGDDGVVDDHAHGEAHPRQADDVDVAAQEPHGQEGADDRDRDRRGDDRHRADAAQEDEEDHHRQCAADDDVGAHQADGAVDVVGLVVDLLELEALAGQGPLVEVPDGGADAVHDLEDVGPGLALGVDGDRRGALLPHRGHGADVAEAGAGDLADGDPGAVGRADDDLLDVRGLLVLADGAHDVAALALVEGPGAGIGVLAGEGLGQVLDGDLAGGHGPGIDDDLELPFVAAVDVAPGDAGHALEGGLDDFLGVVAVALDIQVAAVRQGLEHDPGDRPARPAAAGRDHGPLGVEGIAEDLVELVGDQQHHRVGIDADVELEGDDPAAVVALAGHQHQSLDAPQLLLLALDDLLLDLFRAGARPHGGDRDDRPVDVRGELNGDPEEGDQAEERDQEHADGHADGTLDGCGDQAHGGPTAACG